MIRDVTLSSIIYITFIYTCYLTLNIYNIYIFNYLKYVYLLYVIIKIQLKLNQTKNIYYSLIYSSQLSF